MNPCRWLRKAAYRWHCLIARSELATRLYVPAVGATAMRMPAHIGTMIEWAVTGQGVPWNL